MKKHISRAFVWALSLFLLVSMLAGCSLGKKTLYLPEKVEVYYNGELSQTGTYQYDKNGFLTKFLASDGEYPDTTAIICDENGNVLSANAEQSGNLTVVVGAAYAYTYSTKGNMLSKSFSINGQTQYETKWEYNSKHQVTRAVNQSNTGGTMEYLYEYDKDGKLLAIHGLRDEKQASKTTFEYDKQGRMVLETLCDHRGTEIYRVDYRYEDGKTTAEFYRKDLDITTTYVFDHAGNLVEEISSNGGIQIRYVYTYREAAVSKDSPRRSYTGLQSLPATGLTTLWQ